MGEVKQFPRGIRNNNPLNIRTSNTKWLGEAISKDPAFEAFESPEFGIRAAVKIIRNYKRLYNLNTVEGIISKWAPRNGDSNGDAPGGEYTQPTDEYIADVANKMGVDKDKPLNLDDPYVLLRMVSAMIKHENGVQPYSDKILLDGVKKGL